MIIKYLLGFVLVINVLACGQSKSESTTNKPNPEVSVLGPTLPQEIKDELLMRATNIDVIFFSLPISMNQDEKYSVNKTINFIENRGVKTTQKAPSIGRMSVLDNGEVLRDIDIHYNQLGLYFATYENNKPKYYNAISTAGNNFFNNLISQAGGL